MTIWAAILIVLTALFIVCAAFSFGYAVGSVGGRKMSQKELQYIIRQVLDMQSKCDDK